MKRTTLLRRTPLRRVSKKRQKDMKEYSRLRAEFLAAHPHCQVFLGNWDLDEASVLRYSIEQNRNWGIPASTDVHHKAKRGKHYLDVSTWMAVSRKGHEWIHAHPREARARGWLV